MLPYADALSVDRERDACGIGFVAHLSGAPSHTAVDEGLSVLEQLEHRGACGCDGTTGDGAGLLLQIPDAFVRDWAAAQDVALPAPGAYGVGTLFLPQDEVLRAACMKLAEATLQADQLTVRGWRRVPTAADVLGNVAAEHEPVIMQCVVAPTAAVPDAQAFERMLYVARRSIERQIATRLPEAADTIHVASLSAQTVVYKGMLTAGQLRRYFPDLSDTALASAFALVHARFSTNTLPQWSLAQPFRRLCHNGEINTLRGNVNRMRAREAQFGAHPFGEAVDRIRPVLDLDASDSCILDSAAEVLLHSGRSLPHALRMLIPPAWERDNRLSPEERAFFQYHACLTEPWDGPAAIAFADGTHIGTVLDRSGLRPARYLVTDDGRVVMASEAGAFDVPEAQIVQQQRLGPGDMTVVDLEAGALLTNEDLIKGLAEKQPYRAWLDAHLRTVDDLPHTAATNDMAADPAPEGDALYRRLRTFGYTQEDLDMLLGPMGTAGSAPIGSMGDDTPLAMLSERPRLLYDYFRQLFAQVTNPPLDAIREELVTSLYTYLGPEKSLLEETPAHADVLRLEDPLLTPTQLKRLRASDQACTVLDATVACTSNLQAALNRLFADADAAVRDGTELLIVSDHGVSAERFPMPLLLAVAGLHHHLIRAGTRTKVSLVVDGWEPREVHHVCCLLGYGAEAICPRGGLATVRHLAATAAVDGTPEEAADQYRNALSKGILKVMSKMGISTLQSYQGAQIFEAVGLHVEVVDTYFTNTPSRIGGARLEAIEAASRARHAQGYPSASSTPAELEVGGRYRWRRNGEAHALSPKAIAALQHATRSSEADTARYEAFAAEVNRTGAEAHDLRSLLQIVEANGSACAIDEVEPWTSIVQRFKTGAMSYGAISDETHRTLAEAMNRLNGHSNTGEGGEHPERYPADHPARSAVKQVASGRFGVTLPYLASADEIQIKMAQGAKPGEGGQLPGEKVYPWIADVRFSMPGVPLISPPPHHDIYSIEDLAQLIYDLKNTNPEARISVKLVSEAGVGTVAAGVAKAKADHILISGHSGGTGASPQTSIMHAGLPWEMGLADAHQMLVTQGLRNRVSLETDGGLRTGRDVVVGALLGAEEFGFSTAPLISLGCIMMRKCHLNTCPVGIATQDPELREKFNGTPEQVINYFYLIAEEVRGYMARLGMRTFDEMIGRTDRLLPDPEAYVRGLELGSLLTQTHVPIALRTDAAATSQDHGLDDALDHTLIAQADPALEEGTPTTIDVSISNRDRTVGTLLSRAVVQAHGNEGLPDDTLTVRCRGTAGQSFAAFGMQGLTFDVRGIANDYLGKGLSGARIVLRPPEDAGYRPEDATVAGNVALYGATSGTLLCRGQAGERFAVRNSGVEAVVEGVGDHGCEYMTGGCVVVLGPTGRNFAAGMSGGLAYVWDRAGTFADRCNTGMVDLHAVKPGSADADRIRTLLEAHHAATDSPVAAEVLSTWPEALSSFVKVFPKAFKEALQKGTPFDDLEAKHEADEAVAVVP
ncbi:MAG: glutamate synthase large subunit [Bacteroidetes bacterium]|jgi:glutamate synthase domain-containing protein 2/glutamate synthase domain-containing protein 1/glutamate synthase domain-containing protein 3|nr:glutamate synthase large subunit [Bacteroidota bacterium]